MKMCSDVHFRVGTPHMNMCSDVKSCVGISHIKMYSDVLREGVKNTQRGGGP